MILVLSAPHDPHAEAVVQKLRNRTAQYLWFDTAAFPATSQLSVSLEAAAPAQYLLQHEGKRIDLREVRAIWHRRPGVPEPDARITDAKAREWVCQESQSLLEGIWNTLDCLHVPGLHHDRYAAENKLKQLVQASQLGFSIPRTLVTNRPSRLLDGFSTFEGRAITKVLSNPVVPRAGDDVEEWSAFTRPIHRRDLAYRAAIRYAPVIVQEYAPKLLEVRVTVVGSQVFAAAIHSQNNSRTQHDWRHYDFARTPHEAYALPERVSQLCIELVQSLNLNFGAIDLVLTPDGEYVFLEINPSGQWLWIQELTDLPISDAIAELLVTARP
jgi:MvdD pre-ATP grasp domain/RimK-like ATP-grasp domain